MGPDPCCRNPIRAGLCENPEEWRWSSHRATLGGEPPRFLDTKTLLVHFGTTPAEARERYRAHCEQDDGDDLLAHPLIAGEETFVLTTLGRIQPGPGIPRRYFRNPRPTLADLLASPDIAAVAAAHDHGYPLREIARNLGVHASTVSRRLRRHRTKASAATDGT